MNLDILISAANWLYEYSPAKHISKERNAILVHGDGDLADALFDMLFTTAFMPNSTIELVRVCKYADEKCEAFLNRNPDGLEHFARTPVSDDALQRPLAIHFMDVASDWHSFNYAYAILPEGIGCGKEIGFVASLEDVPILHGKGAAWSAQDEADVPVLRIARKVHTAYTLGWNDRYREEDIDRDLYGSLTSNNLDSYMLRSSIRLAVSIPWKLVIAEARDAETFLRKLSNKNSVLQGHAVRDYLAWQEHRSWQAFMTLDGWRMPDLNVMAEYMFKKVNDHRDKGNKLHPCLCDIREDDWFSGKRTLKGVVPSEWSKLYKNNLEEFTRMDQVSLRIHHRCKEIVLQKSYRNEMKDRFDALEQALIICHPLRIDIHFGNLRLVENMFERLLNNETNSYHPYELACHRFMVDLEQNTTGVSVDIGAIRAAFDAVQRKALVAIERNKYCDYREIDSNIVDWLPWIIADTHIETIWKLYCEDNGFTNLMSSIILRPRNLILVYQDRGAVRNVERYKAILAQHGLADIAVSAVNVSELENGVLPIEEAKLHQTVIDVSEAPDELEYNVDVPQGVKIVYFSRGVLRDRIGAPGCARYFPQQVKLGIDEVLQIKGKTVLSLDESNDLLGMEQDYYNLWKLCTEMKPSGTWHQVIEKLQEAEQAIRLPIYRNKGRAEREITYPLPEGAYEKLVKNGGMRTLYDLQKRGAVSHLLIDANSNELALRMYPHETEGTMDYSDSETTLKRIILDCDSDSRFAVDTGYSAMNEAIGVYDLHSNITVDPINKTVLAGLNKLVGNGYIRRQANPKEYAYKSTAVRHALAEEGFALETYVYYTLFLSGRFDDVRANVRIATEQLDYNTLETELDVLVIRNGVIGIISCKDTHNVKKEHIRQLAEQAKMYGIKAKPILVCAHDGLTDEQIAAGRKPLSNAIIEQCDLRGVERIGYEMLAPSPDEEEENKRKLIDAVCRIIR